MPALVALTRHSTKCSPRHTRERNARKTLSENRKRIEDAEYSFTRVFNNYSGLSLAPTLSMSRRQIAEDTAVGKIGYTSPPAQTSGPQFQGTVGPIALHLNARRRERRKVRATPSSNRSRRRQIHISALAEQSKPKRFAIESS